MTEFKIGDKVVGNGKGDYGVTKKGNGYGIVTELIDLHTIALNWFYDDGKSHYDDGEEFTVNKRYFNPVLTLDKDILKLKEDML